MIGAQLVVIDDLFLRRLPPGAADELADILMSRYEKASTIVTSNRPIDDWSALLGDVVVAAPLLDRLMHHGHLLKFDGKSWRLKESAERNARRVQSLTSRQNRQAFHLMIARAVLLLTPLYPLRPDMSVS